MIVERAGEYLAVVLPRSRVVFPGGLMLWQEQPQQTAEREGREETGLHLHAIELMKVYSNPTSKMTKLSAITFAYTAEVVGGELCKNAEGRPCWLNESELRQRMLPDYLRILDDYLAWQKTR